MKIRTKSPEPLWVYLANGDRCEITHQWQEIDESLVTEYMRERAGLEIEERKPKSANTHER